MTPSRRSVLGGGLSALSWSQVRGANDRVRIAGLGTGGRCRYLLTLARQQPGTELVAICDVYEPRCLETKEKLAPGADITDDYRRVLDRRDVDAVIIGSPDHWHVPMTVDAVKAGKDVYVEKPLTKNVEEGAGVIKAVHDSNRIVQIGYQQRSWPHFRAAQEIVAGGKLGKIGFVQTSWYQNYLRYDASPVVDASKLDWDRWLGSAPKQPVNALRYFRWRWFWDFGGGHLTDLHSHYGDVVHWFTDSYTPVSAAASGGNPFLPAFECPDTITCVWNYPGFTLTYLGALGGSLEGGNIVFRGTQAMMKINRDGYAVYPEGKVPPEKTHLPDPEMSMKSERDGTVDHMANWLECLRSRKEPNSPARLAVPAANAAHLGNAAYRRGTRVSA